MIEMFLTSLRLLRAVWRGMRTDEEFRSLLVLFVIVLTGGCVFYAAQEGWSVLDSLYFCVMTMSTIGYGDFVPSNSFSKVFTMVYTLVGIGLFASVVGKILVHLLAVRREGRTASFARDLRDKVSSHGSNQEQHEDT